MVVDVSAISFFAPIFSFLLVFIVVFAVLYKTEFLGELLFVQLLTSFVIAALFISVASVKQYVVAITAWFGVLAVSLFFLLFLLNFIGKWQKHESIGVVVVILLCLIFLISFLKVFGGIIGPYLPGSVMASERDAGWTAFFSWLYSSPVVGALILIIVCVIVSWVLVKAK